jgi:2',3'-cyclic-nucleotide 2'-phosphodiesterase (5'-nucleotidase family)
MRPYFAVVVTLVVSAYAGDATGAPAAPEVTVLYHGDLDGRLGALSCGDPAAAEPPDYAALVGAIEAARADLAPGAPAPLTVLGGNFSAPDLFAAELLRGGGPGAARFAEMLARGRYDAVALGPHELALPPAQLDALLPALAARGLVPVASNVRCDVKRRPACAALRKELLVGTDPEGRIGVLAVISLASVPGIPPERLAGVAIEDPLAAVRDGTARLRAQGAARVVLVVQEPHDTRAFEDVNVLQRLGAPGSAAPDLILVGGVADPVTGRPLRLLRREGAPAAVGSAVGTRELTVATLGSDGEIRVEGRSTVRTRRDPATAALLGQIEPAICARAAAPLTAATFRRPMRREDLVHYVLEVMRRRAGAEIAIVNAGFVGGIDDPGLFPLRGRPTRVVLRRALPYDAALGVARITGPAVETTLAPALANPKLAVAGLARGPHGITVNGRPLDKAREYRIATIGFVADGGDGILPKGALPFQALIPTVDVRQALEDFVAREAGAEDGDPTIDPSTDFGRPPSERALVVGFSDLELDLADTSISNLPGYTDAQLARAQQTVINGDALGILQMRHPVHDVDGRFELKYGWARTEPVAMPAVSAETTDLITAIATYTFKGLRGERRAPRPFVPDPYARVWVESELTRPALTPTQTRSYHHLQMTDTAGAQLTLLPKLRVRGGAGARKELLAPGDAGRWQAVVEAGAVLDQTAIATWRTLAVRLEGTVDYSFVEPFGTREHQLRTSAKLSLPLVPRLYLSAGVDVFAVQRESQGWGSSYDTTLGLRVHFDGAHQQI